MAAAARPHPCRASIPSETSDPDDDRTTTSGRRSASATRAASAMVSPSAWVSAPRWWPDTERACTTRRPPNGLDRGAHRARDVGAQGKVRTRAREPRPGRPRSREIREPGTPLPPALMLGGWARRQVPGAATPRRCATICPPGPRGGGGDAGVCDARGSARRRRDRRPPARDGPDARAHPGLRDLRVRPPLPAPRRDDGVDDRRHAPLHGRPRAWGWHPSTCRATS